MANTATKKTTKKKKCPVCKKEKSIVTGFYKSSLTTSFFTHSMQIGTQPSNAKSGLEDL